MVAALRRLFSRPAPVEPSSVVRENRAYLYGVKDRKLGYYLGQNPFDRHAEAALWRQWRRGWRDARS